MRVTKLPALTLTPEAELLKAPGGLMTYIRRWVLFFGLFAVPAALASCASVVANHESEVQFKTVQTPAGPLRLAVIEKGQGRPILLLHGFAASSYTWHALVPELAKKYRVIAIDLRGFGASEKPLDDRYSIQDQADAVSAFIEQENLRDLTVTGHSYGGGIALLLALKDREAAKPRIRNMVLIDTMAYRQPVPIFFRLVQVPMVGDLGMALVPPEVQASQGLRLAYYNKDKISEQDVAEYAHTLDSPAAKHALMKTIEKIVPDNIDELASRYKTIKIPTLIVWCQQDKVVPVTMGLRLREEMPSSELALFTECGHMPQEEKPEETVAAIQAFFKKHRS